MTKDNKTGAVTPADNTSAIVNTNIDDAKNQVFTPDMAEVTREMMRSNEELAATHAKADNQPLQGVESDPHANIFGTWGDFTADLYKPRPPIEFIYQDLIPKGLPGGLFASGGTGKTFFCIQQSLYGAAGLPFGELIPTKPLKTVFFCAEDQKRFLLNRAEGILESDPALKARIDLIKENSHIQSLAGATTNLLQFNGGNIEKTAFFDQLMRQLEQWGDLDLIALDPMVSFWGLPENDAVHGQAFINCLTKIAIATGASVQIVHHVPKGATMESISTGGGRGTSAIYDGLRWAFGMLKVLPTTTIKGKEGKNPEINKLRVMTGNHDGMFAKFFSAKSNHAKELSKVIYFMRGQYGQLEPIGDIDNFTAQAKLELPRLIESLDTPLSTNELTERIQGDAIRRTLAAKYDITKSALKTLVDDLITEGRLKERTIPTGGKPKLVLQVA